MASTSLPREARERAVRFLRRPRERWVDLLVTSHRRAVGTEVRSTHRLDGRLLLQEFATCWARDESVVPISGMTTMPSVIGISGVESSARIADWALIISSWTRTRWRSASTARWAVISRLTLAIAIASPVS